MVFKLKKRSTGENATASLPSDEGKDPPPKIRIEDSDKWLAGVLAPGRFPMQYYNRFGAKKSRRCELGSGQRRTSVQNVWAVVVATGMIGLFYEELYWQLCDYIIRRIFEDKFEETDKWINIYLSKSVIEYKLLCLCALLSKWFGRYQNNDGLISISICNQKGGVDYRLPSRDFVTRRPRSRNVTIRVWWCVLWSGCHSGRRRTPFPTVASSKMPGMEIRKARPRAIRMTLRIFISDV